MAACKGRRISLCRLSVLWALCAVLVVVDRSGAVAAPAEGVSVRAEIDGRPVRQSTETRPIALSPLDEAPIFVEVTNRGTREVKVRSIRLEGRVVGLPFFSYNTLVLMRVAPGATESRSFVLDLVGLERQAVGLIPSAVQLIDQERRVIAGEAGVVDVRGSLVSVYGLFGLGVALVTLVSFAGAIIGMIRHTLSPNRWKRGLRFMTPGLGIGLVINFTLSATRVLVPAPGRWLAIVLVSGAVLFGLGYLTPSPMDEDKEDEEEELEGAVVAIEGRPAREPGTDTSLSLDHRAPPQLIGRRSLRRLGSRSSPPAPATPATPESSAEPLPPDE